MSNRKSSETIVETSSQPLRPIRTTSLFSLYEKDHPKYIMLVHLLLYNGIRAT